MNKILKFSLLVLLFVGLSSCDSTDDNTSYLDNRVSVSFFAPGSSGTLLVKETSVSSFDIVIGISEPKPVSRAYTVSVDPSSTAVENVDFTMSSTLTMPANSTIVNITITADYGAST